MAENIELSERELEILELVATGASNKEIAQQLYISANTVKVHLRNIFSKIGATTRTEAAMYAVQVGLVQASPASIPDEASPAGEGEEMVEAGAFSSSQVIEEPAPPRWQAYTGWLALALLLLLAAVGVWAATAREPASPALASPAAPAVEVRWQEKSHLPTPRAGLAVAAVGNAVYAIAGEAADGISAVVERYNPETDRWEARADKPTAVADVGAAVIGGKIYVPGGRLASGEMSDALEVYDPVADEWSQGAGLPVPLSGYAWAALEGKLYLFGGWDGSQALDDVYQYDPGLDSWTEMASLPTARAFAGAGISGGKIYVLGGYDGQRALDVNEVFQPSLGESATSPWEQDEPMHERRYAMGVASVVDIIYLIGGGGSTGENSSLEYVPVSATWQVFDMPVVEPWSSMGLVLSGQQLYLLGGELSGVPTGQNLAYQAIYTVAIPSIIK